MSLGSTQPPSPTVQPPSRRPVVLAGGLLLILLVALAVRNVRRSADDEELHAAQTLSGTVLGGTVDLRTHGEPGALLQSGVVDVVLRNGSPKALHVLSARLDGAGPVSPGSSAPVRPGAVTVLPVTWRVRCAEVGVAPGPRLLQLRVRLRSPRSYAVSVPLTGTVTDRAFHGAAVLACDVLVRPPTPR